MRTPERRGRRGVSDTQTEVCITQPFLPGITVGGVPLGHEASIRQYMSTLTAGFVSYIRSTIHQLGVLVQRVQRDARLLFGRG